jgi:hypothetical protein
VEKRKFLNLPRLELRPLSLPARNKSLYRLRYPDSSFCRYAYLISDLGLYNFVLIDIVRGGIQLGPLGTAATNRRIVPVPGDYDGGEIGGIVGRGNRSTRIKPAPVLLCPRQTPHAARMRTRAAAVRSQRLTA